MAIFSGPPPVSGLGSGGGFKFMVEDRGENDLARLQKETDNLVAAGNKDHRLKGLMTIFTVKSPQKFVNINRDQC